MLRRPFSERGSAPIQVAAGQPVIPPHPGGARSVTLAALEVVRPFQWLKNALVFLPLLAAHRLGDADLLSAAVVVFIAFSLCASAVYVTNDLHDAGADAAHPHKKFRPIASGRLPSTVAWLMVPLLLLPGVAIGAALGPSLALVLAAYFVLMLAYSRYLKRVVLLDALVLAAGYALRVVAGGLAVGIAPSPRLIAFCVFLFFSLALLKRYAELSLLRQRDGDRAHARSYELGDAPVILAVGISSGVMSVLVLVLYVSFSAVARANSHPEVIWATCVLLLYWISHVWLAAQRGHMTDDPLVFAVKDRMSLVLIGLMGATAWLAL